MRKAIKWNKLYRRITIILCFVLPFFTVMMGTFAWYDFTQHKANIFRGTVEKTMVTLHKYEKDLDGVIISHPVANARFKLYYVMDDGTVIQIGGIYITDQSGKITTEKLNSGTYYFEETEPGYGYTYDLDGDNNAIRHYPFTITADDAAGEAIVEVEAYNRRLRGEMEIVKTVSGTGADLLRQFEFIVAFSDGGDYKYKINGTGEEISLSEGKLYLSHGERAVFYNLPAGVFYQVIETYDPDYFTQSIDNQGTIKPDEKSIAKFTNTFHETNEKGSLEITKTVSGTGADTEKEFEFQVTFSVPGTYTYQINDAEEQQFTSGGSIKLKNNQTAVFLDLPVGLSYTVIEISANTEGYTASADHVSGKIIPSKAEVLFHNHKNEPDITPGTLAIKKRVSGTGADLTKLFRFTVTFSDNGTYPYAINGNPVGSITQSGTIELRHNETAVFSNIPAGVSYTVTEDDYSADNYTTAIREQSGTVPSGCQAYAHFHNHYEVPDPATVKLTIIKKVEGIVPETDQDKEFWFTFTLNDEEPVRFALKADESKTFTIPAGAVYSVIEDDYFTDHYIQTSVVNGSGSATEPETIVTVTNTYVGTIMISIKGEKTWDLKDKSNVELPDSITIHLKSGTVIEETKTVRPDSNGTWTYTFTVPKFDREGKEIVYTIEEDPVPGFKSTVDGYNIKNTYDEPETISVKAVKKWIGEDPNQPDSIRVQLYKNSVPYGESVTLNHANAWTYTWMELDASAVWTVDELFVPAGYTKKVEANGSNVFTITNTWATKTTEENVTIQGSKTWVHGENPVNSRPTSITITIKKGNYVAAKKVVTAADNWSWSFKLPKYESDGSPIQYTITENNVPNYTTDYDGYNIKNTFVSTGYKGDEPENSSPDPVRTGDTSKIWIWLSFIIFSLLTLTRILLLKKCRSRC